DRRRRRRADRLPRLARRRLLQRLRVHARRGGRIASGRNHFEEDAMAGRFGGTTVIDRPIDAVFAFLADGENDPKFSSRVLEIRKTTDGPPGGGPVYASTVKDGGVKFKREFKLTEFEPPTKIRWTEISSGPVETPEGGY